MFQVQLETLFCRVSLSTENNVIIIIGKNLIPLVIDLIQQLSLMK